MVLFHMIRNIFSSRVSWFSAGTLLILIFYLTSQKDSFVFSLNLYLEKFQRTKIFSLEGHPDDPNLYKFLLSLLDNIFNRGILTTLQFVVLLILLCLALSNYIYKFLTRYKLDQKVEDQVWLSKITKVYFGRVPWFSLGAVVFLFSSSQDWLIRLETVTFAAGVNYFLALGVHKILKPRWYRKLSLAEQSKLELEKETSVPPQYEFKWWLFLVLTTLNLLYVNISPLEFLSFECIFKVTFYFFMPYGALYLYKSLTNYDYGQNIQHATFFIGALAWMRKNPAATTSIATTTATVTAVTTANQNWNRTMELKMKKLDDRIYGNKSKISELKHDFKMIERQELQDQKEIKLIEAWKSQPGPHKKLSELNDLLRLSRKPSPHILEEVKPPAGANEILKKSGSDFQTQPSVKKSLEKINQTPPQDPPFEAGLHAPLDFLLKLFFELDYVILIFIFSSAPTTLAVGVLIFKLFVRPTKSPPPPCSLRG